MAEANRADLILLRGNPLEDLETVDHLPGGIRSLPSTINVAIDVTIDVDVDVTLERRPRGERFVELLARHASRQV